MQTGSYRVKEELIRTLILRSEIWQILRRIKPEKHLVSLKPRDTSQLPFLDRTQQIPSNLLYDTTVYIDVLQRRFPYEPQVTLRAAGTWHSPATEAELILLCGFLNPTHPKTRNAVQEIISTLDQRRAHRTIVPDREVWMEASVLAGLLARL